MSRIGDIHSSYGNRFSIAVANTFDSYVLSASKLPHNTFIVTAPNIDGEDIGSHSMMLTDSYGTPVRLTYSIVEGNGLHFDNESLRLNINKSQLTLDNNDNLSLDVNNLIDNDSVKLVNGTISINTEVLQTASNERFGTVKVDGKTIKSDNGEIYVNTDKLDLSDNVSNTKGIIYGDSNSVSVSNGVVSVVTQNLTKSGSNFGIAKADGASIVSEDGILSATLSEFTASSVLDYGLAKGDDITTYVDSNNIIHADFSSLQGLIQVDGTTLNVDGNGVLHIIGGTSVSTNVEAINEEIQKLDERITYFEERITYYSPVFDEPAIFAFTCNGLSSVMLTKPEEFGEIPENMPEQKVSAEFTVRTNCPFNISLDYEDNISPQVVLYEIDYDNIDVYPSTVGLTKTFQSTDNKDIKLKFSWLAKNYRTNDNGEYLKKTKIKIEIRSADDSSKAKHIIYSIVRFNSLFTTKIDYDAQDDEIIIDKYKESRRMKVNYGLSFTYNPNDFSYNNGIYEINDNKSLYHSYIDNGELIKENRRIEIEDTHFIRLIQNETDGDILTTSTPGVTTEVWLENKKINNVNVDINETSIVLTYNGNFSYEN